MSCALKGIPTKKTDAIELFCFYMGVIWASRGGCRGGGLGCVSAGSSSGGRRPVQGTLPPARRPLELPRGGPVGRSIPQRYVVCAFRRIVY